MIRNRWQYPVDIPPPRITPQGRKRPVVLYSHQPYNAPDLRARRISAMLTGTCIGLGLGCLIIAASIFARYFGWR